jgi:hypothetical protein
LLARESRSSPQLERRSARSDDVHKLKRESEIGGNRASGLSRFARARSAVVNSGARYARDPGFASTLRPTIKSPRKARFTEGVFFWQLARVIIRRQKETTCRLAKDLG